MTINSKKIYTRHTKETCFRAINKAFEILGNIRIEQINEEKTKILCCRKGMLTWNTRDVVIYLTDVLNGLVEIHIIASYNLISEGNTFDMLSDHIDGLQSHHNTEAYLNRTVVEKAEEITTNIFNTLSKVFAHNPAKQTPVSNIWHHGDSLYQKLKQLDELRHNKTITVDEFATLQRDLIDQVSSRPST